MKYSWNYDDVNKEIDKLLIMAQEEKDLIKKSYYLRVIDQVKCLLVNNKEVIITNNQKMNEIINSFNYYGRYYSLIELYNLIVACYNEKTEEIVNAYNSLDEPELFDYEYIPHDEVLSMNYEFFSNMDQELFDCFKKIYKERYSSIKFTKNDQTLKDAKDDGNCLFIDVVRKNFININDSKGLSKAVNLAHECGHAVANLFIGNIYDVRDEFLGELASIFFEMAFHNDIGENIDSFENTLLQFEKMNYFNYISDSLLCHQELIESWQYNEYNVSSDFYRYLKDKYKLKRYDAKECLNINIESEGPYVISYMVALELLHIYKDNKNEALNILKKMLIKSKINDSLDIISEFIPSFDNLNLEIGQLHDKINKEFIKKKILNCSKK